MASTRFLLVLKINIFFVKKRGFLSDNVNMIVIRLLRLYSLKIIANIHRHFQEAIFFDIFLFSILINNMNYKII